MINSDLMVFYIAPTRFEFVLGYAFMSATYNKLTSNMQKKTKGKMRSFRRKKDTAATCNVLWAVYKDVPSARGTFPSSITMVMTGVDDPEALEAMACREGKALAAESS
jgi:hypothetical protein